MFIANLLQKLLFYKGILMVLRMRSEARGKPYIYIINTMKDGRMKHVGNMAFSCR